LDSNLSLYVAGKIYRRWGKSALPADIRVDSLNDYQAGELKRFKDWPYQKRVKVRREQQREARRQEREQEAERKKAEQPVLFEL